MTIDKNDLLNSILASLSRIDYVKSSDIPNIDLYMDQVTSFMEKQLKSTKRNGEDKILTKTMINNYAKSRLIPAPEKKKYSKDHILILSLVLFFKNVLSISDVTSIMTPIIDDYYKNDEHSLEQLVKDFIVYIQQEDKSIPIIKEFENIESVFKDLDEDSKEKYETLTMIATLSYDMFIRKIIIERLIDSLPEKKGNWLLSFLYSF